MVFPRKLPNDDRQRIEASEPTFSWPCVFCGKLRIYEGGCPSKASRLDNCPTCGCPVECDANRDTAFSTASDIDQR